MKNYINTRSINKDYRYLGAMPDNSWLNVYHELTSFEHSTIICEKDHDQFRLFLSGMPSTRLDKVGTKIRYSFLFVGVPDELSQVAGLVSAWASAIDDNSSLAKKLGELYSEDAVQNMIEHHVFDDDAQNQLMTWLKSFDKTDHTFVNQIHQIQTGWCVTLILLMTKKMHQTSLLINPFTFGSTSQRNLSKPKLFSHLSTNHKLGKSKDIT